MNKGLRRVAVVAVSTLVAIPALASVASANSTFAFDRLGGANRYATSVLVAEKFGTSTNVILANGTDAHTVDALTSGYLAGVKKAPIMLTQLAATPADVLARITASGATDIWLVGGEGVISAAQATALDAKFGTVHRLGGLDRFLTAQKVIGEGGAAASKTAIVTTGFNFPDALGAGPLSYVKGMPIGITGTSTLPAATLKALQDAGVTSAIVLGGPTVVTPAVVAALTAGGIVPFVGAGVTDGRIFGRDRAETSTKLADYMITNQGFSNTGVNVASGEPKLSGADALGGGALSGKENRPTLITGSSTSPGFGLIEFFTAHAATLASGHIFGGTGAVSAALSAAMTTAAKAVASNQTFTVAPTTAAVIPLGGTAASMTRTYTATVPSGTVVDIQLFLSSNITTDANGVVTFANNGGTTNTATLGTTTGATITSVNGVPGAPTSDIVSGGTITFAVTGSTTAVNVTPVIFDDTAGDSLLTLAAPATANADPKKPTDAFGIGGAANFVAAIAPIGSSTPNVDSVNLAGNFFAGTATIATVTASRTYQYDANDVFQFQGVGITLAQFESMLSVGDDLAVSFNPDAAGVSTFNVTVDAAATAVGAPTVTVINADAGLAANDVRVVYTRPSANAAGVTYTLQQAPVTAGTDTIFGTVDDVVGTFAAVTGATDTANADGVTNTFAKNNVANGQYRYRVNATNPVSGATAVGTQSAANTVVPAPADTLAPTSAYVADKNGAGLSNTLDAGDTVKVAFSEIIALPAAGSTVQVSDADGTIVNLVRGAASAFTLNTAAETVGGTAYAAGRVLTIAVTTTPVALAAGSTAGLQLGGNVIDSSGILDLAGNAWNITGSADKALNLVTDFTVV